MFDNLDTQDREICEAMIRGVSNEEIKAQFGVGDDKIAQLRPVVSGVTGKNEAIPQNTEAPAQTEAPKDETADEAKATPDDAQPQAEEATA